MKYSKKGDWILDEFLGSGTTLIEAKLLGRNAIGVDINSKALEISKKNLAFESFTNSKIFIRQGSAIDLSFIKDESIDFICTHPPYADIIRYSDGLEGDISLLTYDEFLKQMRLVAKEAYRVLKPNRNCAYMIGDIRQKSFTKPLGMDSMQEAMEGEPVRRHVSDAVLKYHKPVYGMFIATKIDTNTAETFRQGIWYTKDNIKQRLDIVPFSLAQFQKVFERMFESGDLSPQKITNLMTDCEGYRDLLEAPAWKDKINELVDKAAAE